MTELGMDGGGANSTAFHSNDSMRMNANNMGGSNLGNGSNNSFMGRSGENRGAGRGMGGDRFDRNRNSDDGRHGGNEESLPTVLLKMRGLPYSAVPEDVVQWFNHAELGIQPLTTDKYTLVMSHVTDALSLLPARQCSALP